MSYCWKCGEAQDEGSHICLACGAREEDRQPLPGHAGEEARALRRIYDHYGCKRVLQNSAILYNALGDILGEDGKLLRNRVRMVLEGGLGQLYLRQRG